MTPEDCKEIAEHHLSTARNATAAGNDICSPLVQNEVLTSALWRIGGEILDRLDAIIVPEGDDAED